MVIKLHASHTYFKSAIVDYFINAKYIASVNKEVKEVQIILHPTLGLPTLLDVYQVIKSKPFNYTLREINRIIRNKIYKRNNTIIVDAKVKDKDLLSLIFSGSAVKLEYEGCIISIIRGQNPATLGLFNSIKNLVKATFIYYKAKSKKFRGFINYEYKGIRVGDVIMSTSLRNYPSAGGEINKCQGVLNTIHHALEVIDYADSEIKMYDNNIAYIIEYTYIPAIYNRIVLIKGGNIIYKDRLNKYTITSNIDEHPAYVKRDYSITKYEKLDIDKIMTERISNPSVYFDLTNSLIRDKKVLMNVNNEIIKVRAEKWYAVLFIHSFDDAQYVFGDDGFIDLYEWTTFTVDKLIEQGIYVLIKSHPFIDYNKYPGDKIALSKLKKRYSNFVQWLDPLIDSKVLSESFKSNVIGITHHGNVSDELVYHRVPTIGYQKSQWSSFNYVYKWSSKDDYNELLANIRTIYDNGVMESQMEELYLYLHHRIFLAKKGKLAVSGDELTTADLESFLDS